MALVTGKEILDKAHSEGYAVGAFNINNMEILQGIIKAAKGMQAPVIIATSEGAIKYAGIEYLVSMVKTCANMVDIPIALHLDHGRDMNVIKACMDNGYTSIMIDASHLPLEENIRETKKVVDLAHPQGISVEAELGRLKGIEDTISVEERDAILIDPEEAKRFVESTQVDSLAPAIGTSHGAFKFKGEAALDFKRLEKVKQLTGIPLVLHGASGVPQWILNKVSTYGGEVSGAKGVPNESITKAISLGINKINIDTDLRLALSGAIRQVLQETPKEFDPRKILGPARDAITKVVTEKIELLGCKGKT
jgi:fructose-bisphosphate aldolase class II